MIRKSICGALLAALVSSPAMALGIDDLARVVLGGNSVLKKAEQTCGTSSQLSLRDNATLGGAIEAVRRSLAPDRFTTLENVSRADADSQAQTPAFCTETRKKKKGLLSKVGKAGREILLGGLRI